MTALVACDLDRTLIYSANSMALEGPDHLAPAMVVAEVYQGAPLSFMTRESERLLERIKAAAHFVPATTRTMAQYARIQLPCPVPEYAITTNGGVLLRRGVPDEDWQRGLGERIDAGSAPLRELEEHLGRPEFAPWILRVRRAEDLFVYAIVDREAMPAGFAAELGAFAAAAGWTVSVQGRKLYCIPSSVSKAGALAEIRDRTASSQVIAAGDSLLDAGMLQSATAAFRPGHGELHATGYAAPHLRVTAAVGILAGEEILRGIEALVSA